MFFGYLISLYQSRSASLLAVLYSFLVGIIDLVSQVQGYSVHEWEVTVAILSLVISFGAFLITVKYHRLIQSKVIWKHVFQKSLLSLIYGSTVFWWVCLLGYYIEISGNIDHYKSAFNNLWVALMLIPIGVTFKGWLPFTKNKPVTYLVDQYGSEINIFQTQNSLQEKKLAENQSIGSSTEETKKPYNRIDGLLLLPAFLLVIKPFCTILMGCLGFSEMIDEFKLTGNPLSEEQQILGSFVFICVTWLVVVYESFMIYC